MKIKKRSPQPQHSAEDITIIESYHLLPPLLANGEFYFTTPVSIVLIFVIVADCADDKTSSNTTQ